MDIWPALAVYPYSFSSLPFLCCISLGPLLNIPSSFFRHPIHTPPLLLGLFEGISVEEDNYLRYTSLFCMNACLLLIMDQFCLAFGRVRVVRKSLS